MRAVNEAGIGWHVVRTWPGTRDTERAIKNLRSGRRLCPECTEHPLTGAGAVARAAALRQQREARAARRQRQEAQLETQRAGQARRREAARAAAAADPYKDGQRMARQWLATQDEAGRTADQIESAHKYVTGPWAEMAHRTEAETDRYRGYTELVRAALAEFREYEADTGPAGPAGDEMEEQMQEHDADGNTAQSGGYDADAAQYEHDPGSWLARDGDGQVLEVDADGHPGRESSPDDGRPAAEAAPAGLDGLREWHAAAMARAMDVRAKHEAGEATQQELDAAQQDYGKADDLLWDAVTPAEPRPMRANAMSLPAGAAGRTRSWSTRPGGTLTGKRRPAEMRFPWQQTERERELRGEIRSLRLGRIGNPRLASLAATKAAALKSELEAERRSPEEKYNALAREYLGTGSGAAYEKLLAGGHLPGLAPGRRAEASADREAGQ